MGYIEGVKLRIDNQLDLGRKIVSYTIGADRADAVITHSARHESDSPSGATDMRRKYAYTHHEAKIEWRHCNE